MKYLKSEQKAFSNNGVVFRLHVEADMFVCHQGNRITQGSKVVGIGCVGKHGVGKSNCLKVESGN